MITFSIEKILKRADSPEYMRLLTPTILFFGNSDVGLVRSTNEDAWGALESIPFYVVADGMGGHQAGEIAAKQTVEYLLTAMRELLEQPDKEWTQQELSSMTKILIENANTLIHNLGKQHTHLKGMGTTICTLLFHEKSFICGHVGDSRIYSFENGRLKQLTLDHAREFSEDSARTKLTRAIGPLGKVVPEVQAFPCTINQIFLMCTDGLTNHLSNEEISLIMQKNLELKEIGQNLVEEAKKKGGNDNITVVLAQVKDDN